MIRMLAALLGLLIIAGLLLGASGLGWPSREILIELRLPRTLLAALIGAGLGLSGAVLQGGLRNPPMPTPGCSALAAGRHWAACWRFIGGCRQCSRRPCR